MSVAINKRSVMTLFSSVDEIYSHQVRFVLAEKDVTAEIEFVKLDALPQDLIDLNPYGTVPTLIDRDLTLYEPHVILEYLDERFPHPPLMPVYPIMRANARLTMYRIKKEWYSALETILKKPNSDEANKARRNLTDDLTAISAIFKEYPYFMNTEFSMIDCYMAPLLWRLPLAGVSFTKTAEKLLQAYMIRLFEREAFVASLTEEERKMR